MSFIAHLSIFLTVATFPLYLFESGGIQLSHLFFGLFVIAAFQKLILFGERIRFHQRQILKTVIAFVIYVIVIQIIAAASYARFDFIKYAAFYVFNAFYVYAILAYLRSWPARGIYWIYAGGLAAILLSLAGAYIGGGGGGRESSFFNNPNQLGYFGVVSISLLLTFYSRQDVSYQRWISLGAIAGAFYLASLSLSKAAIVASAVSVVAYLPRFRRAELFALLIAVALASPLLIKKIQGSNHYSNVVARLESIGEDRDDNLSSRGYNRILRNPEYLLFGAGEGYFDRFGSTYEIHSTVANIIFSYGLIGTSLFFICMWRMFRFSRWQFAAMFLGPFLYGLTHNGIRSSYFWLLFGLFLAVADQEELRLQLRRQGNRNPIKRHVVQPRLTP